MSGIQIAGLASGINWLSIVNELVAADSVGLNQVQAQQTTVNSQISALGTLQTDLTNLSNTVFSLEDAATYSGVSAASTTSGSTWTVAADQGTATGNTTIDVQQLATASVWNGATGIAAALSSSSDVSDVTLASMPTATAVTAGTFTVDGNQVTVTTSESLQDVFDAISTATDGNVTASYDSSTDEVSLKSGDGSAIVLGADNDTSNFLSAVKLYSNDTDTVTSSSALGSLQLSNDLSSANLKTAITGTNDGAGSFTINGVSISYNTGTDTLSTLLSTIDNSGAGVTASYDATDGKIVLTNSSTGDSGISVADVTGNLAAALGLTSSAGASLTSGTNMKFSVNGGATQISSSNTLTGTELGVSGLSVTADTTGTQTIQVTENTSPIETAIENFITAFNQFQSDVSTMTSVNVTNGSVSGSILSSVYEVADWASTLQTTAFSAGGSVSGAINSLDALGIDFNGTTGQLIVSDSTTLTDALSQNPAAVQAFFQTGTTGFGAVMNAAITDIINQDGNEQTNLTNQSQSLGDQITTMQNQIDSEQSQLEAEFESMESAMSEFSSEYATLNDLYNGGTDSNGLTSSISSATDNSTGTSSSTSSSTTSSTTSTSSS